MIEDTYIQTSSQGYVIDSSTRAVINIDNSSYQKILENRKRNKEMVAINERVSKIENDISEIKELLIKALNGR
jgi:archaellum component FlaC